MRQPSTATGADDVLAATLAEEAAAEAPPWSLVGRRVGSIRVHRLLGEGGMGAVYAGYDERLQREVALKVVRFDSLTVNGRARLLSEARILSRLNHPGICTIHDFVSGETTDFLVLELIHGTTLRAAITQGIAPADRLGIAERIAEALVAAHAQGVIHRDLKPSNVMLTRDGQVKVLDFGIARRGPGGDDDPASPHLDPERTATFVLASEDFLFARTTPGKVIGTAGCMSPEQARGEAVTVASDMYSFGLLLQELFTGKSAYAPTLSGAELLQAACTARPARCSSSRSRSAAGAAPTRSTCRSAWSTSPCSTGPRTSRRQRRCGGAGRRGADQGTSGTAETAGAAEIRGMGAGGFGSRGPVVSAVPEAVPRRPKNSRLSAGLGWGNL